MRRDFLEEFHKLAANLRLAVRKTRDVSIRTRQVADKPIRDWVGDRGKNDRSECRRLLESGNSDGTGTKEALLNFEWVKRRGD